MFIILHPLITLLLLTLIIAVTFWRWKKKPYHYSYPLTTFLTSKGAAVGSLPVLIPSLLRFITLLLLALVVARPQLVDSSSQVHMHGIDIMLTLDVSGSMQSFDDLNDLRSRIDVAKKEAIRFVEKRTHDQCGLVLFGKQAVSRCPLTLDKSILKQILGDVSLGVIDADATMLGHGLLIAINRLKESKSASKLIILLTDGQPNADDIPLSEVVAAAKKFGIKIYAVGIGNDEGGYLYDPLSGMVIRVGVPLNEDLLINLAKDTGGTFFKANNPQEMRRIYEKIDALEKTTHEATIYYKRTEIFEPFALAALILASVEWLLTTLVWFIV